MRICAKDVLAQLDKSVHNMPIQEIVDLEDTQKSLAELFEDGEKGPGDKITVISPDGSLYNILVAFDGGGVVIQKVTLKAITGPQKKYRTWEEAQTALGAGWKVYSKRKEHNHGVAEKGNRGHKIIR